MGEGTLQTATSPRLQGLARQGADLRKGTDGVKTDASPHPIPCPSQALSAFDGIATGRSTSLPPNCPRVVPKRKCNLEENPKRVLAAINAAPPLYRSYNGPLAQGVPMECQGCGSHNIKSFNSELAIHFPGRDGLSKPLVWAFPSLEVCLGCGLTNFAIPEEQLNLLKKSLNPTDAGAGDTVSD